MTVATIIITMLLNRWDAQDKELMDIKRERNVLQKLLAAEENKVATAVATAVKKVRIAVAEIF